LWFTLPQILSAILSAILPLGVAWRLLSKRPSSKPSLRSPRMMYHAESFAKLHFETFLIGYEGSKPVPSLLSLPHVHFLYLSQLPPSLRNLPFIFFAPIKIAQQVMSILHTLLWRIPHPPEFILVQNPPSIPTLPLVWLAGTLLGSKVIIDWHNLGYSILALNLGPNHIFVKLAKLIEAKFGQFAYAHLFVTRAMHDFLVKEWNLQGLKAVLHDRPPAHFRPANALEIHELFIRISPSLPKGFLPAYNPPASTPFTQVTSAALPSMRPDRPAVLVSSTSWTEDEDFSILLDALSVYEHRARAAHGALPRVLTFVTGKGPLRDTYMRKAEALQTARGDPWLWVRVISIWLEPKDYPLLLGALTLCPRVKRLSGCGNRVSGPRHLAAFKFFGIGSAHEDRGHVWVWCARVCT
ncbi:hypothetical protein EDB92DRAFT_1859717, partial [Lactarius akahatsu]